ncbi:progranulin-like [Eucyclogobius newberryi]|uniref:progranulin-like n=1 Tax=Eucyclogobius newberryi TaxID=166745 RepID=UPI003B5C3777
MLERFLLLGFWGLVSCYITCPDGQSKCNDQATCCLTEQGYSCCPYPHGVCCADLAHCCPSNFLCNPVTQMCERRWESRPMLRTGQAPDRAPPVVDCDNDFTCPNSHTCCRDPSGGWTCCPYSPTHTALEPVLREGGVIRCDSSFYCPQGSSCCRGPTGQWNCCPYPLAICCSDGSHCCQYGYTCDPDSQVCRRGPSKF